MGSGRGKARRVSAVARGEAPAADNKHTDREIHDGAEAYTSFVRNTPLLTRTQEYALGLRASKGDEAARTKLVERNQLWVLKEARKFVGLGMEFDDLVQEGNLGLMRATRDYSPDRGTFITYARHWVQMFIRRALEQKGSTNKYGSQIPAYLYGVVGKVKKERQRVLELGEPVDVVKIAEKVEEPPARVQAALEVLDRTFVSIDKKVGSDGAGDTSLGEIIPDVNTDTEGYVEERESQEEIAAALAELTDEERVFIEKRYGLGGEKEQKQKDICRELGITRSRASYLQDKALSKLRTTIQIED